MLTVALEPTLQAKLEQFALFFNKPLEQIVAEAISERLETLYAEKLQAEIAVFTQLHPTLKETHFGQFVAIHEGNLVDSDADFETLFLRVQARYGDLAILMRQVSDSPEKVIYFRSVVSV
jgi:hypothetical protein